MKCFLPYESDLGAAERERERHPFPESRRRRRRRPEEEGRGVASEVGPISAFPENGLGQMGNLSVRATAAAD